MWDSVPSASMGEASTLADFLDFCSTNYPADHTAVIFWDHGSGSASGVSFDEIYDYDSLTLDEIYNAFASGLRALRRKSSSRPRGL